MFRLKMKTCKKTINKIWIRQCMHVNGYQNSLKFMLFLRFEKLIRQEVVWVFFLFRNYLFYHIHVFWKTMHSLLQKWHKIFNMSIISNSILILYIPSNDKSNILFLRYDWGLYLKNLFPFRPIKINTILISMFFRISKILNVGRCN